ncbi:cupin domain-containing protein [Rhodococcus koreensis]
MDILTSLLEVHRLKTVVAGRIDLAPPWRLDNRQATDFLVILVQASGESHFIPRQEPKSPIVMSPGDILISLPGETAYYMHDGSDPVSTTWTFTLPPNGIVTPIPLRLTSNHPATSIVCCLMEMGDAPRGPLFEILAAHTHISHNDTANTDHMHHVAEMMIAESAVPGPASTRLISDLAEILLILVLRRQLNSSSNKPGLRAFSDPAISSAIKRIHSDPGYSWTVESLAKTCGMSRSAFAARFTECVGQPPLSYLIGWRMATASQLLNTTDATVSSIATAVGYTSDAAFRRAFSHAFECTPREYRSRQAES